MLPEIRARSLPEANDDLPRIAARAAVVSIGEPGSDPAYGFQPVNPLHLRLEFHDIVGDYSMEPGIVPPSEDHIDELFDRAPLLRTARLVYCHCNAGISRSTATAYILRCLWLGPGSEEEALRATIEDRPIADPNPILVRLADAAMQRSGAMVAALESRDEA